MQIWMNLRRNKFECRNRLEIRTCGLPNWRNCAKKKVLNYLTQILS